MAWKWYVVNSYKASVDADRPGYGYGSVQLFGTSFYAAIKFAKSGSALSAASAPVIDGVQRFYGSLDFAQMAPMIDLLRHEGPINFGWADTDPSTFRLMTGEEPTGENET